jgi:uncharacterized membrane protein
MGHDDQVLDDVDRRTRRLEERVLRLEALVPAAGSTTAPPRPVRSLVMPDAPARQAASAAPPRPPVAPARWTAPTPAPTRTVPSTKPRASSLEDLLGGRVLAWVGGAAVIVGLAYFLALAVSNGWIGEGGRTLLAGAASAGLLGLGVWLHERRGRTDAALTSVSAGIAGLFMTAAVATTVYALIPVGAGLALALAAGAVATLLAVRWESQVIAAIGIVGALLAPVLVGAPSSAETVAILFVAAASAVSVLVYQRWEWLGFAAILVTVPQWGAWLFGLESVAGCVAVLFAFGTLGAAAAIGFELRTAADRLRPSAAFLLGLNALIVALAGWFSLATTSEGPAAQLWLCGLAGAHLAIGLAASRSKRISHGLGLVSLTIGMVLADVAFASLVDGPALALGWALGAVGFAALLRRGNLRDDDKALIGVGLGAHVTLALLNAVVGHAPPEMLLSSPGDRTTAVMVLAAVAAATLGSARLTAAGHPRGRVVLDAVGLLTTAYLTAVALDGTGLVVALTLEACALASLARRNPDEVATIAAIGYLGAALAHVLVLEAPPVALLEGVDDLMAAAVTLGALGAAALRFGHLRASGDEGKAIFGGTAALAFLYLASVVVVDRFQPGDGASTAGILDLGVRQQGQMMLSALWSVVGVGALISGLRGDLRVVRLGALALLGATATKVFMYDLSALTAGYRVASFIGLGVVLLFGAHAYQRMRPGPGRDELGEMADTLR